MDTRKKPSSWFYGLGSLIFLNWLFDIVVAGIGAIVITTVVAIKRRRGS